MEKVFVPESYVTQFWVLKAWLSIVVTTVSVLVVKSVLIENVLASPILKLTGFCTLASLPAQSSSKTRLKVYVTPGSVAVEPEFLAVTLKANVFTHTTSAVQPLKVVL